MACDRILARQRLATVQKRCQQGKSSPRFLLPVGENAGDRKADQNLHRWKRRIGVRIGLTQVSWSSVVPLWPLS